MPLRKSSNCAGRMSLALLILNVIGAVGYVAAASHGWRSLHDLKFGPPTGEPFVWALWVAPILAVFTLLNLSWGIKILLGRRWNSGRLWLLAGLIWIVAILIDFAHH